MRTQIHSNEKKNSLRVVIFLIAAFPLQLLNNLYGFILKNLNKSLSRAFKIGLVIVGLMLFVLPLQAQRHMENLDRGVVAVKTGSNEVFVSWRLLGTEPSNIGFNLYRGSTKVNLNPILKSTNYVDNNAKGDQKYTIRPVIDGKEQEASAPASVWAAV